MRLLLAALLLAGRVWATDDLAVVPDHSCGSGPVVVTVRSLGACPCAPPKPEREPDGTYRRAGGLSCPSTLCFLDTTEHWSDWPECVGAHALEP